jgi:hypothetical protein
MRKRALLVGLASALCLLAASSAAVQVATKSAGPTVTLRDFPGSRSASPDSAEWKAAPELELSRRVGALAKQCAAKQVREWVRVRCASLQVSAITQLGGNSEGARLRLDPKLPDGLPTGGELVFPIRAGERRVFLFWTLGEGYDGPLTVIPALVVQSEWLGQVPVLVLHDALNEPVRTAQSERRRLQPKLPPSPPPK